MQLYYHHHHDQIQIFFCLFYDMLMMLQKVLQTF
jgi:hypothetical protein